MTQVRHSHSFVLLLLLLCCTASLHAQRFVCDFRQTPLSEALMAIDAHFEQTQVNFIFDELEDFTVSKYVDAASAHEAVMAVVGLYPMRVDIDGERIFVECYQKAMNKLRGRVVDAEGQPMEFATVTLLAVQDSTYLAGGVTNENGDFVIPTDSSEVLLRVTYVGYHPYEQPCSVCDVANVTLHPEQTTLGSVIIRGQRPLITREEELTVFHADALEGAETMEATDVLKYVPRVVVDTDGKVRIGQHEAKIFVNDVELSASEANAYLRSLRGDDIERIEVQEVRGADEDASHKGGILRIVTKQRLGLSGSFSLFGLAGLQSPKYNYYPYATAFFGTERWNIYAAYYYAQGNHYETTDTRNEYHTDGTAHDNLAHTYHLGKINYLRLGSTYLLDRAKRHSIGAEVKIYPDHNRENTEGQMIFTDAAQQQYGGISRQRIQNNSDLLSTALSYRWKLDERKDELKVQAGWNQRRLRMDNSMNTAYPDLSVRNATEHDATRNDANSFIARADLRKTLPHQWGIRAGAYFNTTQRDDQLAKTFNGVLSQTSYRYREAITAAYAGVTHNFGTKVFANLSLRMEHTHMSGTDRLNNLREVERTYTDFMPYAYLSYTPNSHWSHSLAYTRSIYRPPFNLLTNYSNRFSEVLIDRGNPRLQPGYTNRITLQSTYRSHSLTLAAWRVNDEIVEFFENNNGIVAHYFTNFGHRDNVSLEYSYSGRVLPWWTLNANTSLVWVGVPSSYNVRYHWSPTLSLVNMLTLKHVGNIEVEFDSNGSSNTGNQYWKGQTYMHISFSRRFANDRLSLRFRFDDVFNSIHHHTVNHVPTHTYRFDRQPLMQKVALTLTWTFGNRSKVRREQVDESETSNSRL